MDDDLLAKIAQAVTWCAILLLVLIGVGVLSLIELQQFTEGL